MRVAITDKISEVLTPDQKREFEVLVDQYDQRMLGFERRRQAAQDSSQLFNPKPLSKRILMANGLGTAAPKGA